MKYITLFWNSEKRVESFLIQTFFDICGFITVSTLSTPENKDNFNSENTFNIEYDSEDSWSWDQNCIYEESIKPELESKIAEMLFVKFINENECKLLSEIIDFYSIDVARSIYTIKVMCMSRNVRYNKTDMLDSAARTLYGVVVEMIQKLSIPLANYAIAYLADIVNEGLVKTQKVIKFLPEDLLERLEAASDAVPEVSLCLLKVSILENCSELDEKIVEVCHYVIKNFQGEAKSICEYKIGEIIRKEEGRSGLFLYEGSEKWYSRCLHDNPKDFRAIYKIAIQYEKKGCGVQTDLSKEDMHKALNQALDKHQNIIDVIEPIKEEWWYTLEVEYMYKAYFRMGNICILLNDENSALKYYHMCEDIWKNLYNNLFVKNLYNLDQIKALRICLEDKNQDIFKVLEKKKDKLKDKLNY